jgi:hypothetical protein
VTRAAITEEVRALERLDLQGLRQAWGARYGSPEPRLRSRELLGLMLAWRIQAEAFGGLCPQAMRKLQDQKPPRRGALEVPVGTVLTREWQGRAHTVRRTPAGFEWDGRTYRSLTAVARAISGGAWSGPLFFGLVKRSGADA